MNNKENNTEKDSGKKAGQPPDPGKKDIKETPGSFLKRSRKELRYSLEYVSAHTRISEDKLKALEEDNYDYFPARFYARSFLKDYAAFLKIEIDADALLPNEGPQPISPDIKMSQDAFEKKKAEGKKKREERPLRPSRSFICAIILIFAAYFIFLLSPLIPLIFSFSSRNLITSENSAEAETSEPERGEEKLMLMGTPLSDVWVRLTEEGNYIYEGTLRKGATSYWEAEDEITIRIGNTGALRLYFKGNTADEYRELDIRTGARGGVKELSIGRETFSDFSLR